VTITTAPSALNPGVAVRDLRAEVAREAALAGTFEWCKWVDGVDATKSNTYAFPGNFIDRGTVQVKLGRPRVILACAVAGSRRYPVKHYRFLTLDAAGTLEATPIQDTDEKSGWALRVRDAVKALLDSLSQTTPTAAPVTTPTAAAPAAPAPGGPEHGAEVARLLASIVAAQGRDILSQPKRLLARLADVTEGRYELERRLLTMAAQEGALTAGGHGLPDSLAAETVAGRMVSGWGTQPALARWAATTWMGVTK
jgi:hypothetical protein